MLVLLTLQLLWRIDNGKAVGLQGVADVSLKQDLAVVLDQLVDLRCTKVCPPTLHYEYLYGCWSCLWGYAVAADDWMA